MYDRDFRLHLSRYPHRSWSVILQQAWMMRLKDRNRQDNKGSNGNKKFKFRDVCWRYNSRSCSFGSSCKFPHRCGICSKYGHGAHICKKAGNGSSGHDSWGKMSNVNNNLNNSWENSNNNNFTRNDKQEWKSPNYNDKKGGGGRSKHYH